MYVDFTRVESNINLELTAAIPSPVYDRLHSEAETLRLDRIRESEKPKRDRDTGQLLFKPRITRGGEVVAKRLNPAGAKDIGAILHVNAKVRKQRHSLVRKLTELNEKEQAESFHINEQSAHYLSRRTRRDFREAFLAVGKQENLGDNVSKYRLSKLQVRKVLEHPIIGFFTAKKDDQELSEEENRILEDIWNFFSISMEDDNDDDDDDDDDDDYKDPFARSRRNQSASKPSTSKCVDADELLDTLVEVVVEKPVSPVKDQKQKIILSTQLAKYRKQPVNENSAAASSKGAEAQSDDEEDEEYAGNNTEMQDVHEGPNANTDGNDEVRNAIVFSLHKLYAKNRMQNKRPGDLHAGKARSKKKKELIVSSLERELAECTFRPKVSKHANKIGQRYTQKTGGVTTSPMVVGESSGREYRGQPSELLRKGATRAYPTSAWEGSQRWTTLSFSAGPI